MAKKSIVIFEDDQNDAKKLQELLSSKFKNFRIQVLVFPVKKDSMTNSRLFETRIHEDFKDKKYGNIALIIADKDLSGTDNYIGLSEAAVSKVADDLAIPICLYARGDAGNFLEKAQNWGDREIILDIKKGGLEGIAREAGIIYDGFQQIELVYNDLQRKMNLNTPAKILAEILDKPELADRLALYSAGNQKVLSDILPYRNNKGIKDKNKRIVRRLGYWLWESILRFPGIVLNDVAAASHLNIDVGSFEKNKHIRKLFSTAVYNGPFGDLRPFWWRDDLDEIILANNCEDGLELVKKKIKGSRVKPCMCNINKTVRAGYYCVVKELPVSAENSRSNLSWFPAGADLARVSNDVFDELGPWLGLY